MRLTRAALASWFTLLSSWATAQEPPPAEQPAQPPGQPAQPGQEQPAAPPAEPPPAEPPPAEAPPAEREAPAAGVAQPEGAEVGAALEKPEAKPVAGYDDGFFIQSEDGNYKLVIGGYVQFRFTYEGVDGDEDEFFFSIPRARIQLNGHLFTPDFTYKIQVDFANGAIPALKDGYADYAAIKNWLHFQAGSFKMPFNRQLLTSGSKLSMVDRAITHRAFGSGRDLGVMIHNKYKSPLEYGVGIFNGYGEVGEITGDITGDTDVVDGSTLPHSHAVTGEIEDATVTNVPVRMKPRLVGRIGYNFNEIDGYEELDLDGGDPRFGIAANTKLQFNADHADEGLADLGGDFIIKFFGATVYGAVFARWAQVGGAFTAGSLEFDSVGMHAGGNYLLDETIWFGAQYGFVRDDVDEVNVHEILGGIGVFAFDKHLKSVLDAGPILEESPTADTLVNWRIRTQLQLLL
jgi:phosphate-selective porin OprO and OprP